MLTDIVRQSRVRVEQEGIRAKKENTRNEQSFDDNEDWIKR
jgi:hypothetical protein